MSIIEFGCGNCRDSFFFTHHNTSHIIACDVSSEAITLNNNTNSFKNLHFIEKDFTRLPSKHDLDIKTLSTAYSRFTLHAVNKEAASRTLKWAYNNLDIGGRLCIEARSTKYSLYGQGESVGDKNAFITTHY